MQNKNTKEKTIKKIEAVRFETVQIVFATKRTRLFTPFDEKKEKITN